MSKIRAKYSVCPWTKSTHRERPTRENQRARETNTDERSLVAKTENRDAPVLCRFLVGDLDRVTFTSRRSKQQRAAGAASSNSSISAGRYPTSLLRDVCIPVKVRMSVASYSPFVHSSIRPSVHPWRVRLSVRPSVRPLVPSLLPVSVSGPGPVRRWDRTKPRWKE